MPRLAAIALVLLLAGCATRRPDPQTTITEDAEGRLVFKPVAAVNDFDNRAGFEGQWKLGEGMAELLTTALLDSDQVIVLERKKIDAVIGEISRQGQALFREEGRVERGRLMNAQYLIRGVITDFTVTRRSSGWFSMPDLFLFGGGSKARVAMNVYVIDVASGKVVVSVKSAGTASAGGAGAKVNYKDVSFGGESFFRTPLGKATEAAIGEAVGLILAGVPRQAWQPVVAEVEGRSVIINGGRNVRLQAGASFLVREAPREVTDPVTGDVIERKAGRVAGRARITEVLETSSHAELLDGEAHRGDRLDEMESAK